MRTSSVPWRTCSESAAGIITTGLCWFAWTRHQSSSRRKLRGLYQDKSLSGALSRIEYRLTNGLIRDECDVAASYAVMLATGHLFNDGNKRTSVRCMDAILRLHSIEVTWDTMAIGQQIIETAQRKLDEIELANWLRTVKWRGQFDAV